MPKDTEQTGYYSNIGRDWKHVVDPEKRHFYHLDKDFKVWTCDCAMPVDERVSLCLTLTDELKAEGELRDVKRQIAAKRKELGLLMKTP